MCCDQDLPTQPPPLLPIHKTMVELTLGQKAMAFRSLSASIYLVSPGTRHSCTLCLSWFYAGSGKRAGRNFRNSPTNKEKVQNARERYTESGSAADRERERAERAERADRGYASRYWLDWQTQFLDKKFLLTLAFSTFSTMFVHRDWFFLINLYCISHLNAPTHCTIVTSINE